ncbi:MAG: Zn-dependent hydrolase of the beta-lactamase fold-like protein [Berkelbacteria bacterium GW2011_GWA1_36_9]|uniref:Zn-dependent hydrolase of the beta-lactamase fold-like protein n=1 Tax=Berkelbacteria bacterium GW2011_GWA1_36_9 TaxID=1618331 RepID=A0A0G0FJP7_9BACT|nr:MAG: Zn-dependent hydrolase of the beta-lactamase fold-like protein [Berkelbacteria bacterium GW2011_GWA1_36_9]
MIITWDKNENFTLKTRNKTVKIGEDISLGDLKITTPGEYESGGIQLEVVDGTIEVFSEKMMIGWMKKAKVLSDSELEKLSGIDVLLIGVGGGAFTETKQALEVINQIDPKVVIPMYEKDLESFTKEEGISSEGQDQFKFTLNDLPVEERKVIILNAS